jgi:cytoskeletal protein CcmA (bactofilin family)
MFGSNKDKAPARPSVHVDTLIGQKTTLRGDISFSGGLHIDGTVFGSVVAESGAEAVLVISEKGVIEGEVRSPHVVINGTVRGDIVAAERIELATQARVNGNIYYKILEMQAGAQVNGQIVREDEPRKQLPKPEAKPAPSPEGRADFLSAVADGPAEAAADEPKASKKRA